MALLKENNKENDLKLFNSHFRGVKIIGRDARFIKDNWQKMSDRQIAEKLNILPYIVKNIRLNLGLKRRCRSYNRGSRFDRSKINKEELAEALNEGGFTVNEFIKYKEWKITRQGLYFILNEMEIEISVNSVRSDIWCKNRYLRIYPQLTDENWLENKKTKDILKELQIGRVTFSKIRKILNIEMFKKKGRQFIDLICFYDKCKNQFKKPLNQYKQSIKKEQKKFYCRRECYFQDRGEN